MRGRWIGILAGILVIAGGVFAWRAFARKDAAPNYRTEALQRGEVRVQVSATGTLAAVTTVQVGSQVSGTIAALHVDFNDQVRKGQVLAQLDATFLRAQVAESRANRERVMAELRQAARDSARVFPLGAKGLVSQSDLDQAVTAVESARAQVSSSNASLLRAETNLRYATVESPIDGVVISRAVDVGQTVAASLQAPTLFTIAQDLTRMQLEAAVDEADIGVVREGQTAQFTVDAYPTESFTGSVHQIRLLPETLQNVVTYTVIILVENPDRKLLPGMTANVSVLVESAPNVFKVPAQALRFRPEGQAAGARPAGAEGGARAANTNGSGKETRPESRGSLYVLDAGGRPRRVAVRTGLTDGTFTSVYSDSLEEGVRIVLGRESQTARAEEVVNPFAPRMGGPRSTGTGSGGGGRPR